MFGIKKLKIKEQKKEIEDQAEVIRILRRDKSRLEFHITQLDEIIKEHVLAIDAFELDCSRES